MNAVTSQRRTRGTTRGKGTEAVEQDLDHPAVDLLAKYLERRMGAPTYVSLNRKVTGLLGYRWICETGPTIPKTREAVCRALKSGKLKAAVRHPLRLIEKRTRFAKALHRDKIKGYENCSRSPSSRFYVNDEGIDVDGNGDRRLLLDTSGDSAITVHARPLRRRPQDESTDGIFDKTITQPTGNDPSSEDPAPIPEGSSVSRPAPEPWATKAKLVEEKACNRNIKGGAKICLTYTGTSLTLRLFRPLLASHGKLGCEIVDACLSMLARPIGRLARQKTALFESTFWRTYQKPWGHLGHWYDMVAAAEGMEMLLFPVCQGDHWTLFEVSWAEKIIRHYAPVGLDSTDITDMAARCLEIEFGIEGLTIDQRPLPQGDSGVLILATAARRVLRKDVECSQEDIPGLCRWIAAILLRMEV